MTRSTHRQRVPPYDYFTPDSRKIFDAIVNAVEFKEGYAGMVLRNGKRSWIAELGTDESITSSGKLGYPRGDLGDYPEKQLMKRGRRDASRQRKDDAHELRGFE